MLRALRSGRAYPLQHRALLSTGGVYSAAIVGSGPSAFYTAKYLLEQYGDGMRVDIYERLPLPFGLVRYGVAPDHQDVKACIPQFEQIAEDSRVRFFGGVEVVDSSFDASSNDGDREYLLRLEKVYRTNAVRLSDLAARYSLVVLGYGAGADRPLTLPSESGKYASINGVISARELVSWYNGHPHYHSFLRDNNIHLRDISDIVIVGNGNVAIDIARILTKDVETLRSSDIPSDVLAELEGSGVSRVHIVGRRGHCQASFTIKEFREMTKLPKVRVVIDKAELAMGFNASSAAEVAASRPKSRIVELIRQTAEHHPAGSSPPPDTDTDAKSVHFRFLLTPVDITLGGSGKVEEITFLRNALTGPPHNQTAAPQGRAEALKIRCGLVVTSIGYRSLPLFSSSWGQTSSQQSSSFFDSKRHTVTNQKGKVVDSLGNVFAVGWCKRGPSGIIGTNVTDARETVSTIIEDVSSGNIRKTTSDESLSPCESILLNGSRVVTWGDYKRIDRKEREAGALLGKIREKIVKIEDF